MRKMNQLELFFPTRKNLFIQFIAALVLTCSIYLPIFAAVGCDLNDPDRDVRLLFPEATGFRTFYVSVAKAGGAELLKEIERRLQDRFSGLFETIDVPYTVYEIYKQNELIGYIHGVNQKGHYGGIQVFLALTPKGEIKGFYLQKFTGRGARQFRSPEFAGQFKFLKLSDFDNYNPVTGQEMPPGKITLIKNPVPEAADDFRAILRAVKKNLILMEYLVFKKEIITTPASGSELLGGQTR